MKGTSREKTVAVVGLGYVGLPLATLAKEKGWQVVGYDINPVKVSEINRGLSPLQDEALADSLKLYRITASTDPAIVKEANVIVVAVPTPVTPEKLPDLTPLTSALESILPYLQHGQLLVVESTINPGVMDEIVLPLLRKRSDLKIDADNAEAPNVKVAYCPERVNPGDKKWTVRNIPRVLGGYTSAGVEAALKFYSSILESDIKLMKSVTEAEAVKIFENSFRDINIAFVNEMARSFDRLGIDVLNVIEGASTKPFAFLPHFPGNGVGGHCISVDPYYMIEKARQAGFDHRFLKLAREINDSMPAFVLELLERGLKQIGLSRKEARLAFLGLAYKKNTGDIRESPALHIQQLLKENQYRFSTFDPYVAKLSDVASLDEALARSNVVMIAADHSEVVAGLKPERLKEAGIQLVIDGKNSLLGEEIAAAGIAYFGIGRTRLPKPIATISSRVAKKVRSKTRLRKRVA